MLPKTSLLIDGMGYLVPKCRIALPCEYDNENKSVVHDLQLMFTPAQKALVWFCSN